MSTDDAAPAAETRQRPEQQPRGASPAGLIWLTAIAPVAISLLSLALSTYTIVEANREPTVWLSAPGKVRIAISEGERVVRFYVQPRIVNVANNDRAAIISDLRLKVAPPDGGAPMEFVWQEQGTWLYDPVGPTMTYYFLADPAPLVVGLFSPELPMCLFVGPPGWRWQAGTYVVTILAGQGNTMDALRAAFTMTLTDENVDFVYENPRGYYRIDDVHAAPLAPV